LHALIFAAASADGSTGDVSECVCLTSGTSSVLRGLGSRLQQLPWKVVAGSIVLPPDDDATRLEFQVNLGVYKRVES